MREFIVREPSLGDFVTEKYENTFRNIRREGYYVSKHIQ
jgi:hypothetical protein